MQQYGKLGFPLGQRQKCDVRINGRFVMISNFSNNSSARYSPRSERMRYAWHEDKPRMPLVGTTLSTTK